MGRISHDDRLCACGRRRTHRGQAPAVAVEGGRAHFQHVQLCGRVWSCPVCSPRIRAERARDLDAALAVWVGRHGAGSVMLATLTLPHDWGEQLRELRAVVRASFRSTTKGGRWERLRAKLGVRFLVPALDVTHGPNGWHPHMHVVVLGTRRLDDAEVRRLRRVLYAGWATALRDMGRRLPSYRRVSADGRRAFYGVDVERARSRRDVGRYIAQVIGEADDDRRPWGIAQEAVRTDLKRASHDGHRTPWQIAEDIAARRAKPGEWSDDDDAADDRDVALWREYEAAMKGANAVRLSGPLRAAVGLGAEKSDEEVVAVEVGGEVVYEFADAGAWLATCDVRGGRARVLRAAERWGGAGCARMVAALVRRWQRRRARRPGASAAAPPPAPASAPAGAGCEC